MKNETVNKVLAIAIVIIIVFGWYITIWGIPGTMSPLKDKIKKGLDIQGGVYVVLQAKNTSKYSDKKLAELMEQTKTVVENRVNQMGLSEPNVAVEGRNRIRVELPGVTDANEAIEQVGKTAQLKFTMADQGFVLNGSSVKKATSGQSQESGQTGYVVNLEFDGNGTKAFANATQKAMSGTVNPTVTSDMCEDGGTVDGKQILIWLDNKVISHPEVNEVINGGKCEISGNFSQKEASNLAALIRGGSLPLEMQEIESSSQTAQIGYHALDASVKAGIIGIILIFLIMLIGYRLMGAVADLALCLYVFLILAGMALMGSVLTLPGIAGIILSIGMAVDANVIIFTRIKEEIVSGKSIRVATQTGYKRALTTIIDSQVTTLIAAIILYQIGSSSVKGFAWTLMIGVICSIITAVFVTQIYLNLLAASKRFAKNRLFGINDDGTAMMAIKKQFHFIKHRKIYYIISIVIIVAGMVTIGVRGFSYGIDFTGGTMLHFDMGHKVATEDVKAVMKKHNVNTKEMQVVFSGTNNREVLIKTNESLNKTERQQVIKDMESTFHITDKDVLASEHFGASVGKELKQNALKAIALAALGMLIYIRLRFRQWKFGAAALLGILHDVLILVTFYAIFGVTVNNPFIAAILTVVGYSINDTIVIFDRVRENLRFMRRGKTDEILDISINQTLTRSIMTSFTTLIVMVPLFILAGSSIREFTLPLMIGVGTGCLSSIFICSPLYYEFSKAGKNKSGRPRPEGSKKKLADKKEELEEPKKEKKSTKHTAQIAAGEAEALTDQQDASTERNDKPDSADGQADSRDTAEKKTGQGGNKGSGGHAGGNSGNRGKGHKKKSRKQRKHK